MEVNDNTTGTGTTAGLASVSEIRPHNSQEENVSDEISEAPETVTITNESEITADAENAPTVTSDQNYTEVDPSASAGSVEMTELYDYEMNMSGATTLDSEYDEYEEDTSAVASQDRRKSESEITKDIKKQHRMKEVDEDENQSFPEERQLAEGEIGEIIETEGDEAVFMAYEEEAMIEEENDASLGGETAEDPSLVTIRSGVTNIDFASSENDGNEYFEANDDGSQIQLVEELVAGGDEDDNMEQGLAENDAELDSMNEIDVIESNIVVGEEADDNNHRSSNHDRKTEKSSTAKKRYMMSVPDESEALGDDKIAANDVDLDDVESNSNEPFLEINTRRRMSQEGREGNCYCGKDRNLNIAELLCASCYRWYHESCIGYQLGKLVPFMMNYVFVCKNCSPNGLESFKRNQAQFTQMCITALANLTQMDAKENRNRKIFSCEKDILPFFEMHWDSLTTMSRRITQSWYQTVTKTLVKDQGKHFAVLEVPDDPDSPYFGLKSLDITQIRPHYEAMIKAGHLKLAESQNSSAAARGRGSKRRVGGDIGGVSQASLAKRAKGDSFLPKVAFGHGYPSDHPFNKDGFRYVLAEPDSMAPFRQEFDESSDWTGKIIPGWLYRVLNPWNVFLALHDRAPQLKVSEDRHSVTGEKGYCMIRATHGVSCGSWYWEAKIEEMPEGSATRIGWGQQYGNLQGPLGVDQFGYSYRSRYGTKFFEAKGKHYGEPYGLGDVIGCLIILPEDSAQGKYSKAQILPPSHKEKPLVRFKSHLYYEDKDGNHETELKSVHEGSKIIYFKNGVCQGVAYENIFDGIYFPSISLYKSINISVNFGPQFEFHPKEYSFRGMNERAEEATIQQTVADLVFLTDNEGKLNLESST